MCQQGFFVVRAWALFPVGGLAITGRGPLCSAAEQEATHGAPRFAAGTLQNPSFSVPSVPLWLKLVPQIFRPAPITQKDDEPCLKKSLTHHGRNAAAGG